MVAEATNVSPIANNASSSSYFKHSFHRSFSPLRPRVILLDLSILYLQTSISFSSYSLL